MKNYVALAGIPGSGKSTLAKILHDLGNFDIYLEDPKSNPYHADYVIDKNKWGFHNEVDFLVAEAEEQKTITSSQNISCQDSSIYQSFNVYIQYLYLNHTLNSRDYKMLERLYKLLEDTLRPPDLLVVLNASPSECLKRVLNRSRSFDRLLGIQMEFFSNMDQLLNAWLLQWTRSPTFTIDTNKMNIVEDHQIQKRIVHDITLALN